MSTINDEITRLKTAKDNLKDSIKSKGVTIGEDTIDKYYLYVDSIKQTVADADYVTKLDYTGIETTTLPRYSASGYQNLEKIIVPANVGELLARFGAYDPNLMEVYLYSEEMVKLTETDYFICEEMRSVPVNVLVNNVATYRADATWRQLEVDGWVSLNEF